MIFFISAILVAISVGLGFVLKKKAPKIHLLMCLLLSFLAVLMLFTGIAVALGKLGP